MALLENASSIGFAFTAGVLTFFAPCAYPLLPGYISYYLGHSTTDKEERPSLANGGSHRDGNPWLRGAFTRLGADRLSVQTAGRIAQAVVVGVLVSGGFFLVYGVLAGIVGIIGVELLAGISILELVVGVILILIGLIMAAGWEFPAPTVALPERRRSAGSYFGFGVLYAAAAAGCTAPIFIAVALKALSGGLATSFVTFGAYAAGMSVLMIGVTVTTAVGRDHLLRVFTQRIDLIQRTAGVLLILAGIVQIYFFIYRFNGLHLLGV